MNPLIELHALRMQEKAIKARIEQIHEAAEQEALTLAPEGGEFTCEGLSFQLQLTEVLDMSNTHRYKTKEAIAWRQKKAAQDQAKNYVQALTKEMAALVKSFRQTHPNWQPDERKLTVKCLE